MANILLLLLPLSSCAAVTSDGTPRPSRPDAEDFQRGGHLIGSISGIGWDYILIVQLVDGSAVPVRLFGVTGFGFETPAEAATLLARVAGLYRGRAVTMKFDATAPMFDDQGNLLMFVQLDNGAMLNEKVIAAGLGRADASRGFPHYARYRALEEEAKVYRRGVWE